MTTDQSMQAVSPVTMEEIEQRGGIILREGMPLPFITMERYKFLTEDYRRRGDYIEQLSQQIAAQAEEIGRLSSALTASEKQAAYYKWRLDEIIPLFQEARDALPAIPLASAKLRGLDLTLGDRMDAAGTRTRADYDAAMEKANG